MPSGAGEPGASGAARAAARAGTLNWLSQVAAVTRFNLQTIRERKGASAAAAFGVAGVVAVLVGVLSIGEGFHAAMVSRGADDTAIVLRSGADTEMTSILSRQDTLVIVENPAVLRTAEGAAASAELFVVINLPKRATRTDANVAMRGVQSGAFLVRDEVMIGRGRMFEWGKNEVVVGRGAALEFSGLDVGSKLQLGGTEWTVAGEFSARGGLAESEIWTDAAVLQPAYQRGTSFQAVFARLRSPGVFQEFKDSLTTDPRLNVKVVTESEFYAEQSGLVYNLINGLGSLVAFLMGLGAVFGALNTMYNAVAARSREVATLRALGFRAGPVVVSVLLESLLVALAGGLAGGGLAWLAFDGFRAATINWQSFSQVTFAFDVTPGLLIRGTIYALVLGLVGGLLPAIRAARMPVAAALREL